MRRIRKMNGRLCGSGAGFLSEAMFLALFIGACSFSALSTEEGLLADYDFSRGSGPVLEDTRGNGNHATIVNAQWVKTEAGYALAFNGTDSYVSVPLSVFNQDAGTWEMWVCADLQGPKGNTVRLFNSRHSREWECEFRTSGHLSWYFGNGQSQSVGLEQLTGNAWNHVAFTWEYQPEHNYTVIKGYGNGVLGGEGQLHGKLAVPDRNRTGGTEQAGITIGEWKGAFFKGMIRDVKIRNRALGDMEIFRPYLAQAESFGRDLSRYKRINVTCCALPVPGKVVVETDYKDVMIYRRASGDEGPVIGGEGGSLLVEVRRPGAEEVILHQSVSPLPTSGCAEVSFDVANVPGGAYEVRATLLDSAGGPTNAATDAFEWAGRPPWLSGTPPVNVLNNLVVELLDVKEARGDPSAGFTFRNPREGWVFFRSAAEAEKGGQTSLVLRGSDDRLTFHTGEGLSSLEAMRFLPAGRYSVGVQSQRSTLKSLVVRSIPELVFCGLDSKPYLPRMAGFGPYDWEFLERAGVLANTNVMMSRGGLGLDDPDHISYMEAWTSQGKKWVSSTGLQDCPTPEAYVRYFLSLPAFSHPKLSGEFLDEISGGSEDTFRAWTGGLHLLAQDERGKGKRLYPYCARLFEHPPAHDFVRAIMDCGHRLGWEVYLSEQPSLSEAAAYLDTRLRHPMMGWRNAFPGVERHIIMTLGYFSAPPETLDRYPSVDYKVFMDMQFNLLANAPVFSGLSGIMEYNNRLVDEEILRWAPKLCRHYAIEGRRERLTSDPYIVPHISNGDFEQGADGWTLSPAEEGAITFGRMSGYADMSGRYPPSAVPGETFLCTRRSSERANTFSQNIVKLTPGRAYSVRFITADRQDLHLKGNHAVAVTIPGAQVLPERTIHHLWEQLWYGKPHPWLNFHRIVFRASGETARLVISDWGSPAEPGGPEGQQLIFNFVQVQPYLED